MAFPVLRNWTAQTLPTTVALVKLSRTWRMPPVKVTSNATVQILSGAVNEIFSYYFGVSSFLSGRKPFMTLHGIRVYATGATSGALHVDVRTTSGGTDFPPYAQTDVSESLVLEDLYTTSSIGHVAWRYPTRIAPRGRHPWPGGDSVIAVIQALESHFIVIEFDMEITFDPINDVSARFMTQSTTPEDQSNPTALDRFLCRSRPDVPSRQTGRH